MLDENSTKKKGKKNKKTKKEKVEEAKSSVEGVITDPSRKMLDSLMSQRYSKEGGGEGVDGLDEVDRKDDGCIGVVLRVLARMCDGQHAGLQVLSLFSLL